MELVDVPKRSACWEMRDLDVFCEEWVRLGEESILFLEFFVVSLSTVLVFFAASDDLRFLRVATLAEEEVVGPTP